MLKPDIKLALCQMKVVDNKDFNIEKAKNMITEACDNNANIVVLPEMFNCPYENTKFSLYKEAEDGDTIKSMCELAKKKRVYVFAGSIPEESEGKIYNTSFVISKEGKIIGKHRKVHLFDIDIPGKVTFKESDTLSKGNNLTVVETEYCKIGVAICYDVRFPEIHRLMAIMGAKVIIVPGAFNMTTGPAHWEIIMRLRALDNQVFVAAVSPARDETANYVSYGNSMVVDPWGRVIDRADEKETILYSQIQLSEVDRIRGELPLLIHRREDLYSLKLT